MLHQSRPPISIVILGEKFLAANARLTHASSINWHIAGGVKDMLSMPAPPWKHLAPTETVVIRAIWTGCVRLMRVRLHDEE
ncbi:hypothetical protein Y032_0141g2260 [Ancylostoma ceylanicum]|uniref:Uncharacterized protein n=1 Tax=Ancylostoma ceylanicum TaxID=53326 RepID=A0A016T338_9BILA|nr:hypothetical protein Y032_0141g2260 [Ancylostoma ceylanicum]